MRDPHHGLYDEMSARTRVNFSQVRSCAHVDAWSLHAMLAHLHRARPFSFCGRAAHLRDALGATVPARRCCTVCPTQYRGLAGAGARSAGNNAAGASLWLSVA